MSGAANRLLAETPLSPHVELYKKVSNSSRSGQREPIEHWTVDYGQGPQPIRIPHVWHLEQPVAWQGPAIYRCRLAVPVGNPHLLFHGVSYAAEVFVNEVFALKHLGIWDAFRVDLSPWSGMEVDIAVRVVKNGGETYPVKQVASGFLPYVYQAFGGIFRPVELVDGPLRALPAPAEPRASIISGHLAVDGERFYARGVLTWGWYPETASPQPTVEVIRNEVAQVKLAGFNLVKFCLWLPPHEYLEELDRQGIMAWLELPIWLPATDPESLAQMRDECLRIVEQYRHHRNILAWTAGCELSEGIDPAWRQELVEAITVSTRHLLVKDNSGGAEMYGGHPAEFGTFDDFHPYCEPIYYPQVLQSLNHGPRCRKPILLGEFNDYDVFRPIQRWIGDPPYWASSDEALNAKGVRWQFDFPPLLAQLKEHVPDPAAGGPFKSNLPDWLEARSAELESSSNSQGAWMRQSAFDATRLHLDGDGWVLTGHRHTPISAAGIVDDAGELVYPIEETRRWTADVGVILLPRRTPPWVNGGNRPGWEHSTVRFAGTSLFQIAVHAVKDVDDYLKWSLLDAASNLVKGGTSHPHNLQPCVVEEVTCGGEYVELEEGRYRLAAEFGGTHREWPIQVIGPLTVDDGFQVLDSSQTWGALELGGDRFWIGSHTIGEGPGLWFVPEEHTLAKPMFRECCYAWDDREWADSGWRDNWDLLSLVVGDQALDPAWLDEFCPGWEPMLTRLDTRTYERHPVLVRTGDSFVTTLRPHGGLGCQPIGIHRNPGGVALLRSLRTLASGSGNSTSCQH